jgi:pimeloyl-ACP methyl ester carboxylesterase
LPPVAGELCRFDAEDGIELQGFYARPSEKSEGRVQKAEVADSAARSRGPDPRPQSLAPSPCCLVHVHGWDGNFYENRFVDFAARAAAEAGLGFFTFNNRGHDYISDLLRPAKGDYVQIGGMYEKLADCVPDIRAAIDFAARRGNRKVILQGHSHGAVKAAHYLAGTQDPRVRGLVLLSPSDDLGWGRQMLGRRHAAVMRRAKRMVAQGKGRQLLPAADFPYPVSAQTFLDCFAPDSITGMFNMSRTDRDEFPELASVTAPVLMMVGTVEEAFAGDAVEYVQAVGCCMTRAESFTGLVIEGAPHNYLGYEKQLAAALRRWLVARDEGGRMTAVPDEVRMQKSERRMQKCGRADGKGRS